MRPEGPSNVFNHPTEKSQSQDSNTVILTAELILSTMLDQMISVILRNWNSYWFWIYFYCFKSGVLVVSPGQKAILWEEFIKCCWVAPGIARELAEFYKSGIMPRMTSRTALVRISRLPMTSRLSAPEAASSVSRRLPLALPPLLAPGLGQPWLVLISLQLPPQPESPLPSLLPAPGIPDSQFETGASNCGSPVHGLGS